MASRPPKESDDSPSPSLDDHTVMDELNASQSEALYPLEDTDNPGEPVATPKRPVHLTFLNCLALVISLQIGSGIFSAPSQVSAHTSSPVFGVLAWVVAGVVVYTGAMAFAELGVRMPRNGGVQEYLRRAYGDFCGCVFSWTCIVIAKPSSMAIISTVFSDYFCRSLLPGSWRSVAMEKLVAFGGLVVVTSINCIGVRSGAFVANVFLCSKIFTLLSITFAGLVFFGVSRRSDLTNSPEPPVEDPKSDTAKSLWDVFGNFITAMFGALYCYGGWDNVDDPSP